MKILIVSALIVAHSTLPFASVPASPSPMPKVTIGQYAPGERTTKTHHITRVCVLEDGSVPSGSKQSEGWCAWNAGKAKRGVTSFVVLNYDCVIYTPVNFVPSARHPFVVAKGTRCSK